MTTTVMCRNQWFQETEDIPYLQELTGVRQAKGSDITIEVSETQEGAVAAAVNIAQLPLLSAASV